MTEYNENEDRVSANNWLATTDALAELDALKFSFAALVKMVGEKGSYERMIAELASDGFRHRVDYLHDSFRRLVKNKSCAAAAIGEKT